MYLIFSKNSYLFLYQELSEHTCHKYEWKGTDVTLSFEVHQQMTTKFCREPKGGFLHYE